MKIFLLFYMCHFAMGLTHCYKTTDFFTFISETVILRWAHAARQFVSIELSFHPYNIQRHCPRGVPRGNKKYGKNSDFWTYALTLASFKRQNSNSAVHIKPYLVVIPITMFQCFIRIFNIISSRYSDLVMLLTYNVVETQKRMNHVRANTTSNQCASDIANC